MFLVVTYPSSYLQNSFHLHVCWLQWRRKHGGNVASLSLHVEVWEFFLAHSNVYVLIILCLLPFQASYNTSCNTILSEQDLSVPVVKSCVWVTHGAVHELQIVCLMVKLVVLSSGWAILLRQALGARSVVHFVQHLAWESLLVSLSWKERMGQDEFHKVLKHVECQTI